MDNGFYKLIELLNSKILTYKKANIVNEMYYVSHYTKSTISSYISNLYNSGLIDRIDKGIYKTTNKIPTFITPSDIEARNRDKLTDKIMQMKLALLN